MQVIGYLDKKKLGAYSEKIITDKVIITDERIEHIEKRHPGDYEKYIKYIPDIIINPDYILEDNKNCNTVILLKTFSDNGKKIQLVIKLQTNKNEKNRQNSILTFWQIRDKNYKKTIENNKIIFEKLDKKE